MNNQLLKKCNQEAEKLRNEIGNRDRRIEDEETKYLNSDTSAVGSVFKGYEGLLAAKDTRRKNAGKVAAKDEYLFSLSSATSDVYVAVQQSAEQQQQQQAAEYEYNAASKRYPQKAYNQKGRR